MHFLNQQKATKCPQQSPQWCLKVAFWLLMQLFLLNLRYSPLLSISLENKELDKFRLTESQSPYPSAHTGAKKIFFLLVNFLYTT